MQLVLQNKQGRENEPVSTLLLLFSFALNYGETLYLVNPSSDLRRQPHGHWKCLWQFFYPMWKDISESVFENMLLSLYQIKTTVATPNLRHRLDCKTRVTTMLT